MIRVHVKFFAAARDAAGTASTDLELPTSATVADALAVLIEQFPPLATHADRLAVAVNLSYARRDQALNDDDELALIPPVSGG